MDLYIIRYFNSLLRYPDPPVTPGFVKFIIQKVYLFPLRVFLTLKLNHCWCPLVFVSTYMNNLYSPVSANSAWSKFPDSKIESICKTFVIKHFNFLTDPEGILLVYSKDCSFNQYETSNRLFNRYLSVSYLKFQMRCLFDLQL